MTLHQFAYRNVVRNFRIYAAFFMASFFSVFVFFIYSMLVFHPEIEDGLLGNVPILGMVIAEVILVLFSWFFIFYSMKAFLEARGKEFAILLHLGMEKRQLSKLIFLETLLIGTISIFLGMIFGYAFSKFFFMIVREILMLEDLPLYFSWKPFLLTVTVYSSAFIVITKLSVNLSSERKLIDYMKGHKNEIVHKSYSRKKAILAMVLIAAGYLLALFTTKATVISIASLVLLCITVGTYLFFSDTTQYLLEAIRKKKKLYWKNANMLSIAEQTFIMKNNGRMFFIVTMVSSLAFLCIGTLATLSSYTSQYDKLNPLGLIYKGHTDNPYEEMHISSIVKQLEDKGLSYHMTHFDVVKQTSSFTQFEVEVFRESDINSLLFSYGYPMVRLLPGEAMFIPYTEESIKELSKTKVRTVLVENHIPITIDRVYPELIFPSSIVSLNSIIISDGDFKKLKKPFSGFPDEEPGYHLFTFDIPQWIETTDIGLDIFRIVSNEYLKDKYSLPFYFENAGLSYSYLLATYSLFTLVGLLVAAVFLLAAGSFIYFKLYTNLDAEKRKFDVLKRMGLADNELKTLVSHYLFPQFFLPWGIAMMHIIFAFFMLQKILQDIANISIVKEFVLSFVLLVLVQVIYYYLIRWRYIAHVRN
ncbi:putative ABC transport system permease protein [Lysinibacillus composti]|uniref:ABC transporter permease n=1 Tax=Lysinibacillus composti TaxID=720633 RepID=A0A3N9UEA4_9BACI|nr:ABC transporter permease [Lysinibacillus composti]MBM7608678.1 putative ABC transport system permease protein [Lysinibacillus composti]RQW74594.1 ABC transporter permease [Lysinibacillus composti]